MTDLLSLLDGYDPRQLVVLAKKPTLAETTDLEGLERVAFLYTGTELGNCPGIRFAASVADAMLWCESPVSQGVLHGTRWVYFWTTARRFLEQFPPPLDIDCYVDSGDWDERIAAAGVTKIGFEDFARVFLPLGVAVVGTWGTA